MSDKSASDHTVLIYACSGVANTGFLSDQVARKLHKESFGKMTCLAAVAAGQEKFQVAATEADVNLVLDGCPLTCGAKIFSAAGLPFKHLQMTDFGVKKGETAITPELIAQISTKVREAAV
jgi:uncharacterized metal-binding protein